MRTELEIREQIKLLEEESNKYITYEHINHLFRAQIKGLKYALGEEYSVMDGK